MGAEEAALADALADAESVAGDLMAQHAYSAVLEALAGLRVPIDEFFDKVLVMDNDEALRDQPPRLLNRFVAVSASLPTSAVSQDRSARR